MSDRIEVIREELAIRQEMYDASTHWEGCATYHWACAVRALLEEIDRLIGFLEDADADRVKLKRQQRQMVARCKKAGCQSRHE